MYFLNKVVAWQGVALVSAAAIPGIILATTNTHLLIIYNQLLIGIGLSIFFDSLAVLRLEKIYTKTRQAIKARLHAKILANIKTGWLIVSLLSVIEISAFGFSFLLIAYSRHVANLLRVALVHNEVHSGLAISINVLAFFRNVLITIYIVLGVYHSYFALFIALLSFLEIYFYIGFIKDERECPGSDLTGYIKFVKRKCLKIFRYEPSRLSVSEAVKAVYERVLISILLSPGYLITYLSLKVITQYIDAGFSMFAYNIRIRILQTKYSVPILKIVGICIVILTAGLIAGHFAISDVEHISTVNIASLCVFAVLVRCIDVFIAPLLVIEGKHRAIYFRNIREIVLVSMSILILSFIFSPLILITFVYAVILLNSSFLLMSVKSHKIINLSR